MKLARILLALVAITAAGTVAVVGHAAGRVDFKRIELLKNGHVVKSAASRADAGHFVADLKIDVPIDAPCWLALRTPPPTVKGEPDLQEPVPDNELGQPLFGHTSPIYVDIAGKAVFDRSVAESLVAEMEQNRQLINKRAVFADVPCVADQQPRIVDGPRPVCRQQRVAETQQRSAIVYERFRIASTRQERAHHDARIIDVVRLAP